MQWGSGGIPERSHPGPRGMAHAWWGRGCPAPACQPLLSVFPQHPALSFQMPTASLLYPARTPSRCSLPSNMVVHNTSCSADKDLPFAAWSPA